MVHKSFCVPYRGVTMVAKMSRMQKLNSDIQKQVMNKILRAKQDVKCAENRFKIQISRHVEHETFGRC